jgi:hypothetical protein
MVPTNRMISGSAIGIFWGRYGPVGLERFFGPYGLTPTVVALLLLMVAVVGFGVVQNWKRKSNATVTAVSVGSFVLTCLAYIVWVGMRGFPG